MIDPKELGIRRKKSEPADVVEKLKTKVTTQHSKSAYEWYEIGVDYLEKGEYQKAIDAFSRALLHQGNFVEALFGLGLAAFKMSKYHTAIKAYLRAVEVDPENPIILNNLGDAYFHVGNLEKAIEAYDQAIKANPNYMKAYYNRGIAYATREEYDKAIEDFTKVIELKPDFAEAYYLRGLAYEYLERYAEAETDYKKALELNPDLTDAKIHLESVEGKRSGGGEGKETEVKVLKNIKLTFKDVAGMEHVKEEIRDAIIYPMMNPELAREYGKFGGGGVLLYGPPGCGKTYIVKAAAGEAGVAFINAKLSDLLDMYVGNTEKNIHKVFEAARKNAPCILFFDEVDAIGFRRDAGGEAAQALRSAINQFLYEMDGIETNNANVLVIAATNVPWDVDPALRRSGRFTRAIFVPEPDLKSRVAILKIHSRNRPLAKHIAWWRIALVTWGYSAADLKALCDEAAAIPWKEAFKTGRKRPITTDDFIKAAKKIKSTLSPWYGQAKKQIGKREEVTWIDGKKHVKYIESKLGPEEKEAFKPLLKVIEKRNKWWYKLFVGFVRTFFMYFPLPF